MGIILEYFVERYRRLNVMKLLLSLTLTLLLLGVARTAIVTDESVSTSEIAKKSDATVVKLSTNTDAAKVTANTDAAKVSAMAEATVAKNDDWGSRRRRYVKR